MWFLLMLVLLLTNGMSAFGLKMIAAWGLPQTVKYPYLTAWYTGGMGDCISVIQVQSDLRSGKLS
jgi:hypothetical protein